MPARHRGRGWRTSPTVRVRVGGARAGAVGPECVPLLQNVTEVLQHLPPGTRDSGTVSE